MVGAGRMAYADSSYGPPFVTHSLSAAVDSHAGTCSPAAAQHMTLQARSSMATTNGLSVQGTRRSTAVSVVCPSTDMQAAQWDARRGVSEVPCIQLLRCSQQLRLMGCCQHIIAASIRLLMQHRPPPQSIRMHADYIVMHCADWFQMCASNL